MLSTNQLFIYAVPTVLLSIPFTLYVLMDSMEREENWFAWTVGTLLLWQLVTPFYLANRNLKEGENREGGTAWNVIKNFLIIHTFWVFLISVFLIIVPYLLNFFGLTDIGLKGISIGFGLGLYLVLIYWIILFTSLLIIGLIVRKPVVDKDFEKETNQGKREREYSFDELNVTLNKAMNSNRDKEMNSTRKYKNVDGQDVKEIFKDFRRVTKDNK